MLKKYNGASWESSPTWKKMSSGLTSGLISYWDFNSDATDQVGSNNGSVSGATNTTGKLSNGYSFDGNNDSIGLGNVTDFELQTFSFNCWVKRNAQGTDNMFIFSCNNKNSSGTNGWFIRYNTDNTLRFQTQGTVDTNVVTTDTFTDTTNWNMITVTFAAGTRKIYYNGVEVASDVTTGSIDYSNSNGTNFGAAILVSTLYGYMDGLIDESAYYNKVLSTSEIFELYNLNKAKRLETFDYEYADVKTYDGSNWDILSPISYDQDLIDGLIHYYDFEDNANDLVGNNDGTVTGATHGATGKIGNGYSFDGVNDKITFDNMDTTPITFGGWIKFNAATTQHFIGSIGSATSARGIYLLYRDAGASDRKFQIQAYSGSSDYAWKRSSFGDIATGTWYHVMGTYDGVNAAGLKLYVNGALQSGTSGSGGSFGGDLQTTTQDWTLGEQASGAADLNGYADECSVYNRELSLTEIQKLYNNSKARYYK